MSPQRLRTLTNIHGCPSSVSPYNSGYHRSYSMGNAVPVVKVFKTALQKALQTIFRPKCSIDCRILRIQSQNLSGDHTPRSPHWPAEAPPALGRQRSHYSCFTKRPLSWWLFEPMHAWAHHQFCPTWSIVIQTIAKPDSNRVGSLL